MGSTVTESPTNVTPISAGQGSGSNGGSGDYGERLARIETKLEYSATKEDIQKIKVWILVGFIGGMSIAVTLASIIIKIFFSN